MTNNFTDEETYIMSVMIAGDPKLFELACRLAQDCNLSTIDDLIKAIENNPKHCDRILNYFFDSVNYTELSEHYQFYLDS